ncbi:MAG TPA: hypothetical protein VIP53_00745 [Nitrososphaera sp.]|jgi:hypothetical protein
MVTEEEVKCNICGGISVNASQAKQHTSTSSHELNRSRLERDLEGVRIEYYQNDISVIMSWKKTSM